VLNVNSTASGGGVAEMLLVILGYACDAGVDARWLVIDGDPAFFAITKRIHNHLYGSVGDGGALGANEHIHYDRVTRANADELAAHVRPGDVVILHDPQTAGLAEYAKRAGAAVVWRCHVGIDHQNEHSRVGWDFLRGYLEPHVDHYVFTRAVFAPRWVPAERLSIIWPSIDPFSPKNQELAPEVVEAILTEVGLIAGTPGPTPFLRSDGTAGRVEAYCDVIGCGPPPEPDVPLVVQVSRWDSMKDMLGVMDAFATYVDSGRTADLVLCGPSVAGVTDDPEGDIILTECWKAWRELPLAVRRRIQLVCVPMHDLEENAAIINALQRHATVVTQKSLAEGFGLTVAEAMLKGTPVVASAVGGIVEQLTHGTTGLLLDDPTDLETFGNHLISLLDDPALAERIGSAGRDRAIDAHLGDSHLRQWLQVLDHVLDTSG
jgi:trehalose synthase